jgi:hypothetical protein
MTAEKKKRKETKKKTEEKAEEKETGLAVVDEVVEEDDHSEIRKQVKILRDKAGESYWDFAVALHEVYEGGFYRSWGYSDWKSYVKTELDYSLRYSQQLVNLQNKFLKMPQNIQNWLKKLGYAKATLLVRVITADNAAEWRDKIEGKTVSEIEDILKNAGEINSGGGEGGLTEGGGEGGDDGAEKFKTLNFKLAPLQHENVERALVKAKEMAESEKPGNALDLIATEFMSTNSGIDTIQEYLRAVERNAGVRLVAYDIEEDSVIFGGDLIAELEKADEEEE